MACIRPGVIAGRRPEQLTPSTTSKFVRLARTSEVWRSLRLSVRVSGPSELVVWPGMTGPSLITGAIEHLLAVVTFRRVVAHVHKGLHNT